MLHRISYCILYIVYILQVTYYILYIRYILYIAQNFILRSVYTVHICSLLRISCCMLQIYSIELHVAYKICIVYIVYCVYIVWKTCRLHIIAESDAAPYEFYIVCCVYITYYQLLRISYCILHTYINCIYSTYYFCFFNNV